MANRQISTLSKKLTNVIDHDVDAKQDQYITYQACGGLMINDDGKLEQVTKSKFAERVAVDRTTLYNWEKNIPDFWDRVNKRRHEVFNKERMAMVWNGLFMRAAKGDAKQAEMIASHFSDYVPPTQKVQVEAGASMFDLINQAKNRIEADSDDAFDMMPRISTQTVALPARPKNNPLLPTSTHQPSDQLFA